MEEKEEVKTPIEFSTKPDTRGYLLKGSSAEHQLPIRLHINDWNLIKLMLKRDELSFQKFVSLCTRAYLEGDPNIIKCMRTYRTLALLPEDQVSKGVFSNRERAEIYAELESSEKESE